jgi:hypothetical protein
MKLHKINFRGFTSLTSRYHFIYGESVSDDLPIPDLRDIFPKINRKRRMHNEWKYAYREYGFTLIRPRRYGMCGMGVEA